jgi:hypothetical protein
LDCRKCSQHTTVTTTTTKKKENRFDPQPARLTRHQARRITKREMREGYEESKREEDSLLYFALVCVSAVPEKGTKSLRLCGA